MTEAEWMADPDPAAMTEFVRRSGNDRKLRLFACLCCRHVCEGIDRGATPPEIEVAELVAEGLEEARALEYARYRLEVRRYPSLRAANVLRAALSDNPLDAADRTSSSLIDFFVYRRLEQPDREGLPLDSPEWDKRVRRKLAAFLREIFGSPFRSITMSSSWLTSDVVGVARGIYDDRAFDRLPILADALLDAGCDNEDILAHCRSDGPHVRGCWVVDLVLGKS